LANGRGDPAVFRCTVSGVAAEQTALYGMSVAPCDGSRIGAASPLVRDDGVLLFANRLPLEISTMSDMRLVVVGAAGRMGRMLIKAIHEAPGCTLSAAIERPGSALLGEDAGVLAVCPRAACC
jgi:hypothetical protein